MRAFENRPVAYLASQFSTPGASMIHEMTMVTSRMMQYMNLVKKECLQADGQTAQVVLTQEPVRQQARLLKLKIPPILISCQNSYFW
jgi:hypothetical protein